MKPTIRKFRLDEAEAEKQMKTVVIDGRTSIMVPVEKPDEEARNEYFLKRQHYLMFDQTKRDRTRNAIRPTAEL